MLRRVIMLLLLSMTRPTAYRHFAIREHLDVLFDAVFVDAERPPAGGRSPPAIGDRTRSPAA
jgi:hypothetical protein